MYHCNNEIPRELEGWRGARMANQKVNISIAEDYLDHFSEVVLRCEKAGLQIEQQLEQVGVVTGSIDSTKLADLEQVEGVAAVEAARSFQLPPPDSDIQ